MKRFATTFFLLLIGSSIVNAQSTEQRGSPSRTPVRTIRLGDARFYYYEEPETVAATTTFYLSGSQTKAVSFDFVDLTAIFFNRGHTLISPASVQFKLAAGTYRDGCKYKDRYADQSNHRLHVTISAEMQSLFSGDLDVPPTEIWDTRKGKFCLELYEFDLSYPQFTRLINARQAVLTLGTRELKFRKDHFKALRTINEGIGLY